MTDTDCMDRTERALTLAAGDLAAALAHYTSGRWHLMEKRLRDVSAAALEVLEAVQAEMGEWHWQCDPEPCEQEG